MVDKERPIVFTISKMTDNFGGLFSITTKDPRSGDYEQGIVDVGTNQLALYLEIITEELNSKGYSVLFEVA